MSKRQPAISAEPQKKATQSSLQVARNGTNVPKTEQKEETAGWDVPSALSSVLSGDVDTGPAALSSFLKHMRGAIAPRQAYAVEELATMLGLHYFGDTRKVKLVTKSGKFLRVAEDKVQSSRCLFELALVKIVNTVNSRVPVSTSFSVHDRFEQIEKLKPYTGVEKVGQYNHYLTLLAGSAKKVTYVQLDGSALIDRVTGDLSCETMSKGGSYDLVNFDRSKVRSLIAYCEENDISFRLKLNEPYQARELAAAVTILVLRDADKAIVEYSPQSRNRMAPLVAGPEKASSVVSVYNTVMLWVNSGEAAFNKANLAAPKAGGVSSDALQLFADMVDVTKNPQENRFEKTPAGIRKLFYKVLRAGDGGIDILEKEGIGYGNADIYATGTKVYRKSTPQIVTRTIVEALKGLTIPTARMTLKYVHFVLATKELFEDRGGVIVERLPIDPWRAALNIICRHRPKYKLDRIVEHNGDIYPAKWAKDNLGIQVADQSTSPPNNKKNKKSAQKKHADKRPSDQQVSKGNTPNDEGRNASGALVTAQQTNNNTVSASGWKAGEPFVPSGVLPKVVIASAVAKINN